MTLFFSTISHANSTYAQAKKFVYTLDQQTLYCGCSFNGKVVDLASCGYEPRRNIARAQRTEIEHVMPAWQIGHARQCWNNAVCVGKNGRAYKGRACCEKTDSFFQKAAADPHNLFVVIGEINGDRNNFRYSAWQQTPYQYGKCQSITDFKNKQFMPRVEARGIVARAMLYMSNTYQIPLSPAQRKLFLAWDKMYPITIAEQERNQRIEKYQIVLNSRRNQ